RELPCTAGTAAARGPTLRLRGLERLIRGHARVSGHRPVGPLEPQLVDVRRRAEPEYHDVRRILRDEIAADHDLAHLLRAADPRVDARAGSFRVLALAAHAYTQVVVAGGLVLPQRRGQRGVHVQQHDVGVAVVVEVGADDAAPLLAVDEPEIGGALRETARPD